ncbi:MAG: ribonuclease P protein component [Nitriliruptoraceae bacterium]
MTVVDGDHGRLRRGSEIAAVLRSRQQRAGRLAVAHATLRPSGGADSPEGAARARVAVVASRRVGGAVQRNRAKRLLREAVRPLPLRADVDLVLVARPGCASARFEGVRAEVEALARGLHVLAVDATVEADV